MQFVQSFSNSITNVSPVFSSKYHGDYLYVDAPAKLLYFKRSLTTDSITYINYASDGPGMAVTGGALFTFHGNWLYAANRTLSTLYCYQIDSTGRPQLKKTVACPSAVNILISPDSTDLFIKSNMFNGGTATSECVVRFHIGADGVPVKMETVTGSGIGPQGWGYLGPQHIAISPDGKFLYTISSVQHKLGLISRQPTGEIAYVKFITLQTNLSVAARAAASEYACVAISPDGKWLYAQLQGYSTADVNDLQVFKRDATTGDLTFQSVTYGTTDPIANSKELSLFFVPDGSGGFYSSQSTASHAFIMDGATGAITDAGDATAGHATNIIFGDVDWINGYLYSGDFAGNRVAVYKVKAFPALRIESVSRSIAATPALTLWPNPVTAEGNITAAISGFSGTGSAILYNIAGEALGRTMLTRGSATLNPQGLANGVYIINATTGSGKTFSAKMTLAK
jgi:6-phosphogluconolactonase (cycloisomerase 2 family)